MVKKMRATHRALGRGLVFLAIPLLCGVSLEQCGARVDGFEKVSRSGFDPQTYPGTKNDYPWSMAHFQPDGGGAGHLYVGTGNGLEDLVVDRLGLSEDGKSPYYPCEIRRYRPDLGPAEWEPVFSYRDIERGPHFSSTGFRCMSVYRAKSDGVNYLYASTFGDSPAVWRTATGEPGSWERVWGSGQTGSIRWLAPHKGLLYIAISNDLVPEPTPGAVWATDGERVWPVMEGGFGNPNNRAVMSLVSHSGWLYAGTANAVDGYEIWKLEGPGEGPPVKVVTAGGPDPRNQSAATPLVFRDALYYGSQIAFGMKFKGCDLIRIHADDRWETVVGPEGLSGYGPGFDNASNAYLWWMAEHGGRLYAGTCDTASMVPYALDRPLLAARALFALRRLMGRLSENGLMAKRRETLVSRAVAAGADLYRSDDGEHWEPVFTDGLGNPFSYGVRTMVSLDGHLYLGITNPWEGLEIWRGEAARP